MAGGSKYRYQQFYVDWLREKKVRSKSERNIYKALTVLAILTALIAISAVASHDNSGVNEFLPYDIEQNSTEKSGRHLLNVVPPREYEENEGVECSNVYSYSTGPDQCRFVTVTKDCTSDIKFLNYMDFVFCKTAGSLKPIGTIICILWWLFCFIGLAVTADDFFCPSLVVISNVLHLSPNIAGVTFLAFGNGSPDVFSAIAALSTGGDPALGLGGLLGAGVFVTTVVAGTISVVTPFVAMQRPFIRDVIFYVTGVYWTFAILWRGYMYIFESIGYITLYGIYVIIVAGSGSIYKKQQEAKKRRAQQVSAIVTEALNSEPRNSSDAENIERLSIADEIELKNLSRKGSKADDLEKGNTDSNNNTDDELGSKIKDSMLKTKQAESDKEKDNDKDDDDDDEEVTPIKQFVQAINPINVEEWSEMKWFNKIYEVAKAPLYLAITLTCPVVNYEEEETHNWCRYLQILQLVTSPISAVFLIRFGGVYIGGVVPFWSIALAAGFVLAVACFFTSKNETRPAYHDAFGFLGFIMGIIWIYTLANEIVSLLKTFGIVFNINDAILGLTLLAWGNSLGDWISDTVMAKQGFARMGFSACFGGPFFNLSIGFGGAMMISQITNGRTINYGLAMTGVSLVLVGFLMISLCFSLVFVVFILRFKVQRIYGLCLLLLYITFVTTAILAACNVIFNF